MVPLVVKKQKRKRRKSGYITGVYNSPKSTTPIKYRSSWEYYVCKYLDENTQVVSYEYENMKISYLANLRTKKIRNYIPDFVVYYRDGSAKIVEVKRKTALSTLSVQKKAQAAIEWCKRQNLRFSYEIWTEEIIFPIRKKFLVLEGPLRKKTKKKTSKKRKTSA